MVTVSHLVKKAVNENTFLLEAMGKDLVSYGNLAEQLKPEIEKELGKKIKDSAIIMALRRYSEELKGFSHLPKKFNFNGEIIMRTNIIDINVIRSKDLSNKIKSLYSMVDFERGETLNIIMGNNEVSIISNDKYKNKLLDFLKEEKILNKQYDLVALSIHFTSREFISTPRVIFTAVRKLAWEDINIYEIVSTSTELTFIIHKNDSMKAYNLLYDLISN